MRTSLTGGTGDVNPQWLTGTFTQTAADTTSSNPITLPIQRLPQQGGAQVMEVLKIMYNHTPFPAIAAVGESLDLISAFFSTSNFGTTAVTIAEPRVFDGFNRAQRGAFTAGGTYAYVDTTTIIHDLMDGAGHGLLIATDQIFIQIQSTGTGVANTVQFKILYRMKNVSLQEYIGIVQSQQ